MTDFDTGPDAAQDNSLTETPRRDWATPDFQVIELKSALGMLGSPAEGGSAN